MIAVLHKSGRHAEYPYRVVLPAAPAPGDRIEVDGVEWVVADRKFCVPLDGESEVVLRLVHAEDSQ